MIFVVNDNELQRKLQTDLIACALNREVRMFDDGASLLYWYAVHLDLPEQERRFPSCIVLDNFMREVRAPETLLRLRRMEWAHGLRRIPVVVVSAFFTDEERRIFRRLADAMFSVPLNVKEFLSALRRLPDVDQAT